jgi:hypothetical protein
MKTLVLTICVAAALAAPASADQFTESFDGASNVGGWTFNAPSESIPGSGGHPGAYLRAEDIDTYAPQPRTTGDSAFTGDYRALNVQNLGIDLATFYVDFSAADRPCTLMLLSDNGTPGDADDDWAGYVMGPNVPQPADGWQSYDFAVPSQEPSWPAGWLSIQLGPNAPATPDWNVLMGDVAAVTYFYGDPTYFFIFQMWQLGLDNPRITWGGVATEAQTWGGVKSLYR